MQKINSSYAKDKKKVASLYAYNVTERRTLQLIEVSQKDYFWLLANKKVLSKQKIVREKARELGEVCSPIFLPGLVINTFTKNLPRGVSAISRVVANHERLLIPTSGCEPPAVANYNERLQTTSGC